MTAILSPTRRKRTSAGGPESAIGRASPVIAAAAWAREAGPERRPIGTSWSRPLCRTEGGGKYLTADPDAAEQNGRMPRGLSPGDVDDLLREIKRAQAKGRKPAKRAPAPRQPSSRPTRKKAA